MLHAPTIFALAVLAGSTALAADNAPGKQPETQPGKQPWKQWQIPAHVEDITDGDTVRVVSRPYPDMSYHDKVRVLSLDTPEIQYAKCDRERAAGLAAKARAEELLTDQDVTLVLSGERDGFGRLLAYVHLADGRDFAQIMVDEKHGRPERDTNWCKVLTAAAF